MKTDTERLAEFRRKLDAELARIGEPLSAQDESKEWYGLDWSPSDSAHLVRRARRVRAAVLFAEAV